jgi:hypothetical protein
MLRLGDEEPERFNGMQSCPKCNQIFSDENKKVMHHKKHTGQFIDAVCNSYNLQIKSNDSKFFILVMFHNLKNYDAHHIFRHFSRRLTVKYDRTGRKSYDNVNIIALNFERYVSFKIRHLRFIDSYQFRNASLEKLVKNLTND